jgi:hypothetical protein
VNRVRLGTGDARGNPITTFSLCSHQDRWVERTSRIGIEASYRPPPRTTFPDFLDFVFLGEHFRTDLGLVFPPEEKFLALRQFILTFLVKTSVTAHEFSQLLGHYSWYRGSPNPEKMGSNAREDKTVEDECVDVLTVLHLLESWEDLAVVKIHEQWLRSSFGLYQNFSSCLSSSAHTVYPDSILPGRFSYQGTQPRHSFDSQTLPFWDGELIWTVKLSQGCGLPPFRKIRSIFWKWGQFC